MSKKQDILDAALRLFTENGVRATSTKSIATEAGISEALIFKHFGTKDNLLEEIIRKGYQEAIRETKPFLAGQSPQEYICNLIELPVKLVRSNPDFWRMQYKIMPLNPISYRYHENFMRPSIEKLPQSFAALHYLEPALEAELLLIYIDGVWKYFAAHELSSEKKLALIEVMKQKYNL
ncbi:TetR/AcrR family transcriptional regulator [Adhaeribacter sp. BT258]|uniref:TetR/AcrR family transcriptional regulator n=1 Tax=Adhaeribacter terrigena TaxID=2793070 RepID=A0ABS1C0D0_9BACT|nr:TetR/AcrR family transcriptional regulator [Adhaeribacter terrigena]MBK0402795.1 TetR/AcrR family transcriptional regulator [Adhaeribacter terrigena]